MMATVGTDSASFSLANAEYCERRWNICSTPKITRMATAIKSAINIGLFSLPLLALVFAPPLVGLFASVIAHYPTHLPELSCSCRYCFRPCSAFFFLLRSPCGSSMNEPRHARHKKQRRNGRKE